MRTVWRAILVCRRETIGKSAWVDSSEQYEMFRWPRTCLWRLSRSVCRVIVVWCTFSVCFIFCIQKLLLVTGHVSIMSNCTFKMFVCFGHSCMRNHEFSFFWTEIKIKAAAKYVFSLGTSPSNGEEAWHEWRSITDGCWSWFIFGKCHTVADSRCQAQRIVRVQNYEVLDTSIL